MIQVVFIVCQVESYQKILKISCRSLAFTSSKTFSKSKRVRSGNSFPDWFSAWFWGRIFLLLYAIGIVKIGTQDLGPTTQDPRPRTRTKVLNPRTKTRDTGSRTEDLAPSTQDSRPWIQDPGPKTSRSTT